MLVWGGQGRVQGTGGDISRFFIFSIIGSKGVYCGRGMCLCVVMENIVVKGAMGLLSIVATLILVTTVFSSYDVNTKNSRPRGTCIGASLRSTRFAFACTRLGPIFSPSGVDSLATLFRGASSVGSSDAMRLGCGSVHSHCCSGGHSVFSNVVGLLSSDRGTLLCSGSRTMLGCFGRGFGQIGAREPRARPGRSF